MKKLSTLLFAAVLALGLTACKEANPKAEYQAFSQWNESQNQVQIAATQVFQNQLQDAREKGDLQAVSAAINQYASKIDEAFQSLNKLSVKDPEIKQTVEKLKLFFLASADLMRDNAKGIAGLTDELQKSIAEKSVKVQQLLSEAQQMQDALQQKYGQSAAQPQQ